MNSFFQILNMCESNKKCDCKLNVTKKRKRGHIKHVAYDTLINGRCKRMYKVCRSSSFFKI